MSLDRFNRSYPFIERGVGPKFTLTFDLNLPTTNEVGKVSIFDSVDAGNAESTGKPPSHTNEVTDEE